METQNTGSKSLNHIGWISALFSVLVWGITFASTRLLLLDFSALEILAFRFTLAWIVLFIFGFAHSEKPVTMTYRDNAIFAAMGFSGFLFYQIMENCAIYYTSAINVAILVSFGPIVTAVLSRFFSNDRSLSCSLIVGSLISIVGVSVVAMHDVIDLDMRPLGDLMAVAAMLSWGFYSILLDTMNKRGFSQVTVVRKSLLWAIVIMFPLAVWGASDSGFFALDGSFSVTIDSNLNTERFSRPLNLLNLSFLGVLASALAFISWNNACKSLGMVRTTILLYFTPVSGVAFSVLFLGEHLTLMTTVGCIIIMLGVGIANIGFTARR